MLVEFLRSYQVSGCEVLVSTHPTGRWSREKRERLAQLQRPEPRLLSGRWDMKASMRDHEVFTGFWPPGRWALNVEPAETVPKIFGRRERDAGGTLATGGAG